MPKIIDNVKDRIMCEAKRQVFEEGYANMTMRSVAGECKIAIGTIYNYFSSKDKLVGSFMLADWKITMQKMREEGLHAEDTSAVFKIIYLELQSYMDDYAVVFQDETARKNANRVLKNYHQRLRKQIADILQVCIHANKSSASDFLSEFTAEALIAWASERHPFEDVNQLLKKLYENPLKLER